MATAMLPGLGGGTGGAQLAPGQLANSTTAPLAAQNAAAATASGSVLLPNTSAPLLSAPGGAQPGATLPTPQINPNANFNNNVGGAAGTPVQPPNVPGTSMPASSTPPPTNLPTPQTTPTLQLGANGGLPPGLTPMPMVTQMMNTPQMNTAADFAAKYGTAATTPSLAQTTADKFNSLYSTPPKNTPTNTGEAQTAITDATTNQDQQNQDKNQNVQENFMDSYASMNPVLKTMFDQINTLLSQQNTRTSLVDEFTKLENDSGLQADKLSLMNMKNVMAGTEDDIRNEITKAGGFATNSQVMALTAARNKVLQSQATALQDAITTKEDYIKQIVTLTEADYAEADKQVSEQIGLDEKVADMQINLDNAATQNYQKIVDNIGYTGLAQGFKGNPQGAAQAEQLLGLPKGALTNPAWLATNLTNAQKSQAIAKQAADRAGDFTLSPGSKRYDASGNLIASAPAASAAVNGNVAVSVNGKNYSVPIDVAPYYNVSNSGVPYADLSTVQGTAAEKAAVVNTAQAAGIKVITNKNTALDLLNINDANNKLDTIGSVMAGIDQPDALSRDLQGLGLTKLATLTQSNPQQAAAGALQSIGLDILKAISGVQGFRGNQTAVQQVTDHLPSIYDTNDVVQTKIDYIRSLISDREDGILGTSGAPKDTPEPTNTAKGATWTTGGMTYVSDGTKWVQQ